MSSKQVHGKDTAEETLADDENHPLMTRVVQYDVDTRASTGTQVRGAGEPRHPRQTLTTHAHGPIGHVDVNCGM